MRKEPPYPLRSVDHALTLLALLADTGSLRLTDAARELGVSPSTAHRLLSMLVYRDFAQQAADRSYRPGPALALPHLRSPDVLTMRRRLGPLLHQLGGRTGESVNLSVLIGTQVRIIETIESTQSLRVGDRRGLVLPAYVASGGRAMLAALPDAEVATILESEVATGSVKLDSLLRALTRVRRLGYAVNAEESEVGVSAIGASINDSAGTPLAAVSVAVPTARFGRTRLPELVAPLLYCARTCSHRLAD